MSAQQKVSSPAAAAPSTSQAAQGSSAASTRSSKTSTPTSFAAIPPHAHSAVSEISAFISALPQPLTDQIAPLFDFTASDRTLPMLDQLLTKPLAALWSTAKSSLFADGPARALIYLVVGILLNHTRRILTPWLGMPVHATPLADLKLALASPDVFIYETLGTPWREAAFMVFQKLCVDLLGALALGALLRAAKQHAKPLHPDAPQGHRAPARLSPAAVDMARILTVVYLLTAAEYVQARACHCVALLAAYTKLTVPVPEGVWGIGGGGTAAHRAAVREVLRAAAWPSRVAHAWGLVYYVGYALGPMLAGAVGAARRGRLGLLVVVGLAGWVTYVVTRWSNKYYMLLEMWAMVLVTGWSAVAVLVVAREALRGGS